MAAIEIQKTMNINMSKVLTPARIFSQGEIETYLNHSQGWQTSVADVAANNSYDLDFTCRMWQGFLGSSLSSVDLIWFAFYMFAVAPNSMRMSLVRHLLSDPTGATMLKTYLTL